LRRLNVIRKTSLTLAAIAVASATTLLPATALGGAHGARTHTVVLKNNAYRPETLRISRGDSVRWVWRDGGVLHNVVAHRFHSKTQTHGSYTVRFAHAGTFRYTCTVHPEMNGRIVVR
jgi:plastocyanin